MEMKQQSSSAELLPKEKKSRLPWILAGVVLLLAAAYAALCFWTATNGKILPNVTVGDTVVGGMTVAQAQRQIETEADALFTARSVSIRYAGSRSLTVTGEVLAADGQTAALNAYSAGRSASPLLYGWSYLKALAVSERVELPVVLKEDDGLVGLLDGAFRDLERETVPTAWTVEEDGIHVTKGSAGCRYDRQSLTADILKALSQDGPAGEIAVEPVRLEPEEPDWQAIADQVYTAPADAGMNTQTKEVYPSVTGVSLDVEQARALCAAAGEGERFTVPFTFTEPDVTTELLFRDALGEVKTYISGVANRVSNVALAAEMCNDILLMPGDVFSYWDTVGPCSSSQGFLPAPSYVNGATVDSVGGGICQVSSSIYYAALKSNLEIVERQNHSYAVGYVPDGADATVYSGNPDFRFKNNTDYPIRIVAFAKGRNLTVRLEGTKLDSTYVKMEFEELSRTEPETVYKADASIPMGTTKVSVTAYTGRKVRAYRCVYNGDGTLLSRTLESVNNYKKRDKVILCNPSDLALYDPSAAPSAAPSATAEPSPSESAAPTQTTQPSPTESLPPVETTQPSPAESVPPVESPLPSGPAVPSAESSAAPSASPAGAAEENAQETEL